MNKQIIIGIKNYVNMIMGGLNDHYYHRYEHTLEVMDRSIEIGIAEGLNDNEMELLTISALFHDTGFVIQYDNNEYIGASIARNYLKTIGYPEEKIKIIEQNILSTNPKQKAENLYQKILKDADTDNLGRDDFFEKGQRLKNEIETIKKIKILDPDWCHHSINLLKEHKFLTSTEINQRQSKKEENLKTLEEKYKKIS